MRGDLHAHTDASAGRDSLRAMADAARARGFAYHHRPGADAGGSRSDFDWLARQLDDIDRLNASFDDLVLLRAWRPAFATMVASTCPMRCLAGSIVVGAVRDGFELSRDATARMLRAMDHPHFTILAHPTGRVLGERDACELDVPRVIAHAAARGCFVELDAQPRRLDLPDVWCREAAKAGVPVAIGSDACSADELDNLAYGVDQARRAGSRGPTC